MGLDDRVTGEPLIRQVVSETAQRSSPDSISAFLASRAPNETDATESAARSRASQVAASAVPPLNYVCSALGCDLRQTG